MVWVVNHKNTGAEKNGKHSPSLQASNYKWTFHSMFKNGCIEWNHNQSSSIWAVNSSCFGMFPFVSIDCPSL